VKTTYDAWHGLTVFEDGWRLTHPSTCPTYPDGPDKDDYAYGCVTQAVMTSPDFRIEDIGIPEPGHYQIQYWHEEMDKSGEYGFTVEAVT